MSANSLYFSLLPSEILSTIIKYLTVVLEEERTHDVELDEPSMKRERILTVSMIFSVDGPFYNVASTMFTDIHLGHISSASDSLYNNNALVIGHEIFESQSMELGLPERIFQLCGESVQTLSIYVDWNDLSPREPVEPMAVQQFASLVGMYCPNVEKLRLVSYAIEVGPHLEFEDFVPSLLVQFSSKLRSIVWDMNSEAENCQYIPDISVCTNIHELTFPASPELVSFLRTSGSSLESLTVQFNNFGAGAAETISAIEFNCEKLTKIVLLNCQEVVSIVGEERYSDFLCSFGSSITDASIEGLSLAKLVKVLGTCSNLSIDTYIMYGHWLDESEYIGKLGSMIQYLTIPADACCNEKYKNAMVKCKNLKELTISEPVAINDGIDDPLELSFLASLSSSSITHLQHQHFTATHQSIVVIASATWNLRYLSLSLTEPIEIGINFKSITDLNPHLNTIEIIEEDRVGVREREKDSTLDILEMLVKTFCKCHSIYFSLLITKCESVTRDEIHDICGLVPCRGVNVVINVGSTWYRHYG